MCLFFENFILALKKEKLNKRFFETGLTQATQLTSVIAKFSFYLFRM